MIEILATAVITAGAVLSAVWLIGNAIGWRNELRSVKEQYSLLLVKTLHLQEEKAKTEVNSEFIKNNVNALLNKQFQAVLNDQQFSALVQWLETRLNFVDEGKPIKGRSQ